MIADKDNGQDVSVINGVVKIKFDNAGVAKVESFSFSERWQRTGLFVNNRPINDAVYDTGEMHQATVVTRIPTGGVRSKSIENGSSITITVSYPTP